MVEVVVEYEYEAAHEDELTLRQGDIIKNVRRIEEDGWMEGDLNGRRGLFPDNFVKELRKEPKEDAKEAKEPKDVKEAKEVKELKEETPLQRRSSGNVASLVQRISTYGIPTGGLGLQPRASKKKPKKRQCKVLFEYVPQNEDELELKVGDIIDITEEVEEGWWNGTMNGKSGLFPSNFVKEIEMSEEAESNEASDEPAAEPKEDLTSPISPHPGNGVIPQPKKVRGVGFGDIFREGSVKLKPHQPSESEEKKEKPVPSLPPTAKPTHASTSEPQKVEKDAESKAKAKQYCRVTFAYVSSTDDELDLKEGDIIQVLSKDTGEHGWWRGELNGKTGVFPDNFVTLISDSEKETVVSKGSVKQSAKPESEEKPKKPPPPSKVSKSEVPSAEKKLPPPWSEDKVDRAVPDKPAKPSAPTVPPKKPVPPPGKGLLRPGSLHPKRPEKPLVPSPVAKHNGEVSHLRPKSDFEPTLPSKQKTMSGDWSEKTPDSDLMIFDDVSTTSEKLSHPTANRPKMPGRRLPAHFGGGQSPNKEVSEKAQKTEEDDAPRLKPSELRRSSSSSHPALKPAIAPTPEPKARPEVEVQKEKEKSGELDDLRTQMKELVLTIELLKAQQTKELTELRNELDEERLKRVALQMEIEKLKKQVQST